MGTKAATESEIADALADLQGWKRAGTAISKAFTFKDFVAAWGFMSRGFAGRSGNHHPDWRNVWNKVEITLTTHDAGGLSTLDFELARTINRMV